MDKVNTRLKHEFGARWVRVRGPAKVTAHVMYPPWRHIHQSCESPTGLSIAACASAGLLELTDATGFS